MHECASILDSLAKVTSCSHYFDMVHPSLACDTLYKHMLKMVEKGAHTLILRKAKSKLDYVHHKIIIHPTE